MSIIVNDNKLKCILTSYGLGRVAEALQNKEVNLNLSKIKIGDANGEYYEPEEIQEDLKNPIPNGEFFITEKELLEDKLTVSFRTVISENFGNFDIREVGLYETIDDQDYLFAISTQQPMVKPDPTLNYFITIDYYMFLKSANLADVYDQIILNPEDQLVTVQDLEDLMSTILFVEGNLMAQINENSHVIGLNRATQLYERMEADKEAYGYYSTYNNYTSLLNYVSPNDVFGYWVFNYPRKDATRNSILDISKNGYHFSSNKSINLYKRDFQGLAPSLTFATPDYFFLESGPLMNFVDEKTGRDISSTMFFIVRPVTKGVTRTLLARSNYATESHVFEVNELYNNSLEIKIFSDKDNYLTFTTKEGTVPDECHILAIAYDSDEKSFEILINGVKEEVKKEEVGHYSSMNTTPSTLFCFSCVPREVLYADTGSEPVHTLYNADGSVYAGSFWNIENGTVKYKSYETKYSEIDNIQSPKLFAWNYNDGVFDHTIFTREKEITDQTVLLNSDYSRYTGTEFRIVLGELGKYIVQYDIYTTEYAEDKNILPKTLYAWLYEGDIEKIWTNDKDFPTVLLTAQGNIYQGPRWNLSGGEIILDKKYKATYDGQYNIQTAPLNAASYVIGINGDRIQVIDSEVSVVSVIMKQLTHYQMRDLSLNSLSLIGSNPCTVPMD